MANDSSNSVLVGIDFGTTKTYLAYCPPGNKDVTIFGFPRAAFATPHGAVPTAVALERPNGWRIGEQAVNQPPPRSDTASGFKMDIGSTNHTTLGWRNAEVAGKFFAELRRSFQEWDRREIAGLTVTVPAQWTIAQRQATIYAAKLAGFDCPVALLEEPLAAFLRFYTKDKQRLQSYRATLVFDFGGGTCDLSLVDFQLGKPHVVRSNTISLGGKEIDELIVYHWLKRSGRPYEINKRLAKELRFRAEGYKRVLSDRVRIQRTGMRSHDLSRIDISEVTPEDVDASISAQKLEEMIEQGVDPEYDLEDESKINFIRDGIIPPIRRELIEFLRKWDREHAIECVILSGGSCHIWSVQDFLKGFFEERYGKIDFLPSSADYSTIGQSVARGACLHQYYAGQGEQIAIPSLNSGIQVTVFVNGKEFKKHLFDEQLNLPTRWVADVLKGRWGLYPSARGKNFQIRIESIRGNERTVESVKEFTTADLKVGVSPVGELGWTCSIDEYGLVRIILGVIDVARLKLPKKPVHLYVAQEEFDYTDQTRLFNLRKGLDVK